MASSVIKYREQLSKLFKVVHILLVLVLFGIGLYEIINGWAIVYTSIVKPCQEICTAEDTVTWGFIRSTLGLMILFGARFVGRP